jgi:hypothetical protein
MDATGKTWEQAGDRLQLQRPQKILSASSFKNYSRPTEANDTLSRPPKGYDENNPAIGYLKMKSFIVSRKFSDKEVLS